MASEPTADTSSVSTLTTSTESRSLSRRRFAAGVLGAAGLTGLAGCTGAIAGGSETITMLLTPGTPSDTEQRYKPMQRLIEGELDGVEVEMEVPQDYSAIRPALESEQAEIGMDDITLISNPDLMDIYGTTVTGGSAFYFSMMLTNEGSGIESREDVEGKKMAFADRLSTSGSIFATYALKDAGLDIGEAPDGDPVDFEGEWSNHDNALESLANEDADAAVTWSGNGIPHVREDDIPEEVMEEDSFVDTANSEEPLFQPFWWSFPIPKEPVYARKSWDSSNKEEIGELLTNSDQDLIEQYYPEDYDEEELPFTTLEDTSMDTYEPVIERIEELGVELGE